MRQPSIKLTGVKHETRLALPKPDDSMTANRYRGWIGNQTRLRWSLSNNQNAQSFSTGRLLRYDDLNLLLLEDGYGKELMVRRTAIVEIGPAEKL